MPKVTVLMSVYNENNEFLKASIESILGQTFGDFEFLIYDDCSNQENKLILQEYKEKDKRICVITNEVNRGLTYNLADGVKRAKGEYIARMDSDDISKSERLHKQVDYMDKHADVALLSTKVEVIGKNKRARRKWNVSHNYLKTYLLFNNNLPHPAAMLRRDFLEKNSLNYDTTIKKSQDYDLWVRIAQKGKISCLKEALVLYRIHANQISNDKSGEQRKYRNQIRLQQLKRMNIHLSDLQEQYYLEFCEGKLGDNVKSALNDIRYIRNEILKTKEYDSFYVRFLFVLQYLKNIVKKGKV